MKHISDLTNLGDGKDCLIIGGGHSVNEFDFYNFDPDVYIISTNNHLNQLADMIIYYDKDMKDYFTKHVVSERTLLIGFKHNSIDHTCDQCTHYYNYNDILFGDSGFQALQFADKIFNFSRTFLIGFDYEVLGQSYHFDEGISDKKKQSEFVKHSIGKVLNQYNDITWVNKIYNCSNRSQLKTFERGLPI